MEEIQQIFIDESGTLTFCDTQSGAEQSEGSLLAVALDPQSTSELIPSSNQQQLGASVLSSVLD